jgi:hypothetical protein
MTTRRLAKLNIFLQEYERILRKFECKKEEVIGDGERANLLLE